MNDQPVTCKPGQVRGPCGNVNYVTESFLEQDVLTGALIELACTLEQGGEEVLPDLSALILDGLFVSGCAERLPVQEIRATTVRVIGALMQRSSRRTRPPFDMHAFWQSPDDLCAMKTLILLGLRGAAATALRTGGNACHDRLLNRLLVTALTALSEIKHASLLLPVARDIGRMNFRCLDRISRRRRAADNGEVRQITGHDPRTGDAGRVAMRNETEAEGAVLALGSERNLRALRRRAARPSVALAWYGPASVCMLFTLLALGVRDIRLGPDRPTFVPSSVTEAIETYFELDGALFA